MIKVLDSHALMSYLEKEPGYDKVAGHFVESVNRNENLLMTSVNLGEVLYIVLRECGPQKANEVEKIISSLPIEIVDVDLTLAKEAAKIKAFHKIAYADCFAAALTKMHRGELITGDREFKLLENIIKIDWIS